MTISLFSGQGSQIPGMGRDIAEAFPATSALYDTASEIIGRDMRAVCFDSSPEELSRTINAQPAIMLTSLVGITSAIEKGFKFDGVAGHSLGEYPALVISGMVSVEDGFRLIKARSEAMEQATQENKGAMAAIMKIAPEKIEEICAQAKNYVAPVNYNSPQQTVIAGTPEGIEEVSEKFAELKARVITLNVAGAFHSKLMQSASEKFYETAKTITFKAPAVKYYSNVTGGELTDFSDMASILAKHIVSPVRFTSELEAMQNDGADKFVEFGAGKTLTGLVKKTLKGVTSLSIENLESLEGADIYE
ncbi:MAG: ACP S-malonyltransferase [Ruminococcus flavefaciens]|nr:ACP S-malonyltransferase [Ruminococcus flavefaciens]MCM1231219.1 ACP S-malonyltransferase [Ruminococcus flavefaciens]